MTLHWQLKKETERERETACVLTLLARKQLKSAIVSSVPP